MIKAIIFDLDGVLVDADEWHLNAFNRALKGVGENPISRMEHELIYKGKPTRVKLEILQERRKKAVPVREISRLKQLYTTEIIKNSSVVDEEKVDMIYRLKGAGFRLAVASNAIRASVLAMLEGAGLDKNDFMCILSNEEVSDPKPAPDIYLEAFTYLRISPEEALIVEDSEVGKQSAYASGAHVLEIEQVDEVNVHSVITAVNKAQKVNFLIPAAGAGKRFAEAGYIYPKPYIMVKGRPLIQHVLGNLHFPGANFILPMQEDHVRKYGAPTVGTVVPVNGMTDGAARTCLLAKDLINLPNELVIANSDQLVAMMMEDFINAMRVDNADGGMITFKSDDPKWSYASVDHTLQNSKVIEVAEKRVLPGNHATVGIYYFRTGRQFVKAAEQMISKDIRTNGEFYVAPVFNEMILDGDNVRIYEIHPEQMFGLGTPEDLESWLNV